MSLKEIKFIDVGAAAGVLAFTQNPLLSVELFEDWQSDFIEFFSSVPPEIKSMAENIIITMTTTIASIHTMPSTPMIYPKLNTIRN